MTPAQIRNIHVASSKVGFSRQQYKMMLQNVAHVDSCKALTLAGYEDCMAVLEDHGWRQSKPRSEPDAPIQWYSPSYWRDIVAKRGQFAGGRLLHKVNELYAEYQATGNCTYPLHGLVRRSSDHRTATIEQLTPREALNLIELLKDKCSRQTPSAVAPEYSPPAVGPDAVTIGENDIPF